MDEIKVKVKSLVGSLAKYKYPLLILAIGVALMSFPVGDKEPEKVVEENSYNQIDLEKRLCETLQQIKGVGNVEVLLSFDTGFVYTYQEDVQIRTSENSEDMQQQTVIVSGSGTERPVEVSVQYPSYKGALVVCEGADKPSVKLDVVRAVASVTGLSSDHITVIKMKGN